MRKQIVRTALCMGIICGTISAAFAQNASGAPLKSPLTTAVFPFSERGSGVKAEGAMVSDLMFAKLVENPDIWLVEREQMKKLLDEAQLNISGIVDPNKAIKIGQMTGAKVIVTGSIFKIKKKTYLVAKVIGTETSRVLGKSVNGNESIDSLSEKLGENVSKLISEKGHELVAKVRTKKDIIADLKAKLGDVKRPVVFVNITEDHVGQSTIDPAAETEFQVILKDLGFKVTENENDAQLLLKGEGFSEFATRRGNLTSVSARLEVKVLDKAGDIKAVDKQTCISVGLANEQTTGKTALQDAAAKIAERIIPKLVGK